MTAEEIGTLGSAGISLALGVMCILFATGVLKFSKDKEIQQKKQEQIGWLMWLVAVVLILMGILRLFGVMPA